MSALASPSRDFEAEIVALLHSRGGVTKDEIYGSLDAYGVKVDRALQHLSTEGTRVERALDRSLTPPAWRYWLKGEKPSGWGETAAAPRSAEAASREETNAAPAREPPSASRGLQERVLSLVREHPEGLSPALVKARFPGLNVSVALVRLVKQKKLRYEESADHKRTYYAAESPPVGAAKVAKRAPGPKPRPKPASTTTAAVREAIKKAGQRGIEANELMRRSGRNGLTVASQLVKAGEARREGYGRGSRYYFVRDPILKRGGPKRRDEPLGLDVDALDAAVQRLRDAQRELADAEEDLRRLAGGGAA